MALTRKMLLAMDIPAEKIDEIISAHTETINAIKEERDQLKGEVASLKTLEQKLEAANGELETLKADNSQLNEWHRKYDDLKSEFDSFKSDTEAKETRTAKVTAYRKLLKDVGVSENRIDSIVKISGQTIDGIEFDDEGNIKDADALTESVKTEWSDFIPTKREKGADVPNPPANNGGDVKKPSRAAEMVAQYRNEHYGNPMKEE